MFKFRTVEGHSWASTTRSEVAQSSASYAASRGGGGGAERHAACTQPATGASRSGHGHGQRTGQNVEVGSSHDGRGRDPGLLEAFKKARAQTQAKPVQDRIAGTELFLERARKRVEGCRQDVEKAREAFAAAEAKLLSEEGAIRQAEDRLRVLRQEAVACVQESPPATVPANFAQELAQLRDFVSELQRERGELRMELAGRPQENARPRKTNKSLSTPSLDLVPVRSQGGVSFPRNGAGEISTMLETLVDKAKRRVQGGPAKRRRTSRERTGCTFRASCESHRGGESPRPTRMSTDSDGFFPFALGHRGLPRIRPNQM